MTDDEQRKRNTRRERTIARTQRKLAAAHKKTLALELRLAGMTHQQIADELGWAHRSSAARVIKEELSQVRASDQDVVRLRHVQLEVLNVARLALFARVRQGDLLALDGLLTILDHQAKLVGLYKLPDGADEHGVRAALAYLLAGNKGPV